MDASVERFLQRDFGLQTPLLHCKHQSPFFLLPHPSQLKQLTFVLRYLLSARSFFPNTPTHPETRLRLHRTRRQEKRFEGGGEPRQSTGPSSITSQARCLRARRSPRCKGIPAAAGRLRGGAGGPPLRVRARPPRRRSPRAPGRFGPATGHPASVRCGVQAPGPGGGVAGPVGPRPAHLRG